jgi:hypothetical protein
MGAYESKLRNYSKRSGSCFEAKKSLCVGTNFQGLTNVVSFNNPDCMYRNHLVAGLVVWKPYRVDSGGDTNLAHYSKTKPRWPFLRQYGPSNPSASQWLRMMLDGNH